MTLDTPDHIHQGCCCWREPTSEEDRMEVFPTSQKFAYSPTPPRLQHGWKSHPQQTPPPLHQIFIPHQRFIPPPPPPPPPFLQQFSCYNSIKTLCLFFNLIGTHESCSKSLLVRFPPPDKKFPPAKLLISLPLNAIWKTLSI